MNHAYLTGLRAVRYFNLAQADYSRFLAQIRVQAALAMIAHANMSQQLILQLLLAK